MPAIKFNFVPERQIGKDIKETYNVTIMKAGCLYFPADVVNVYELNDKYLRLFADLEKKVIGWHLVEGKTELEALNDARHLHKNTTGSVVIGITKLLAKLGIEKGKGFKHLEVKKYVSPLIEQDIFYIELK